MKKQYIYVLPWEILNISPLISYFHSIGLMCQIECSPALWFWFFLTMTDKKLMDTATSVQWNLMV